MRILPRRRARGASPELAPDAAAPCCGSRDGTDGDAPAPAPARRRTRGRSPEAAAAALAGAPCVGGPARGAPAGAAAADDLTPGAPAGLSPAPRETRRKALPEVRGRA